LTILYNLNTNWDLAPYLFITKNARSQLFIVSPYGSYFK
jgi:hypothetical protein